jgi:serine O-acetyltransferase
MLICCSLALTDRKGDGNSSELFAIGKFLDAIEVPMSAILPGRPDLGMMTRRLTETYSECSRINHLGHEPLPSREAIVEVLGHLTEVLYPGFGRRKNLHVGNVEYYVGSLMDQIFDLLSSQIERAFSHDRTHALQNGELRRLSYEKVALFLERLPELRRVLELDVTAAYRGDPAAKNAFEIIFCYPGLEAVTIYRIAHELLKLGIPYIPRIMTEHAHGKTGIDIHPGATIGPSFFIDHGTGVVIGETCHIGQGVKIYQGVTLGALSFQTDSEGELVRNTKRHPTLEDEVIVYANATVLGGKTIVGARSVIGSSVWLTHSVEPDTVVTLEKPQLRVRGPATTRDEALMYHI